MSNIKHNNFRLGVMSGWFMALGDGLLTPSLVLAAFAAQLGASNLILGVLPALVAGGWMLPQMYTAAVVRAHPLKMPTFKVTALWRTLLLLAIGVAGVLVSSAPQVLLGIFVVLLACSALAAGVGGLPMMEIISKTVDQRDRPRFFGLRNLGGGLLAFGAGFLVKWLLDSPVPFPLNYALIFLLGGLIYGAGYLLFSQVKEPPDEPRPRTHLWTDLKSIPDMLRSDAELRRFMVARSCMAIAGVAEPFFAVYALRNLGLEPSYTGLILMVIAGVVPLSNLFWARVGTGKGNRRVMRIATFFALLAVLTALWLPVSMARWFVVVFVLYSVAGQGFNLALGSYTLNISPAHDRSRYLGMMNTVIGLITFVPALGGLLADWQGYHAVFWLAAFFFVLTWVLLGRLGREH